jgi:hypothetical protein
MTPSTALAAESYAGTARDFTTYLETAISVKERAVVTW